MPKSVHLTNDVLLCWACIHTHIGTPLPPEFQLVLAVFILCLQMGQTMRMEVLPFLMPFEFPSWYQSSVMGDLTFNILSHDGLTEDILRHFIIDIIEWIFHSSLEDQLVEHIISIYWHTPPPTQHLPHQYEGTSKPFQKTQGPWERPADEQDMVMLYSDEQPSGREWLGLSRIDYKVNSVQISNRETDRRNVPSCPPIVTCRYPSMMQVWRWSSWCGVWKT